MKRNNDDRNNTCHGRSTTNQFVLFLLRPHDVYRFGEQHPRDTNDSDKKKKLLNIVL